MTVSLGGLNVLVFTGGVGEKAAEVLRRAAKTLVARCVDLDEPWNAAALPDAYVGTDRARVRTLVLRFREELEIGMAVERVLTAFCPDGD